MRLPFHDRQTAGSDLSSHLEGYRDRDPYVLGIPRGGMPVAREIAVALGAPLGVVPVRKIVLPGRQTPVGAVSDNDVVVWREERRWNADRNPYYCNAGMSARKELEELKQEFASMVVSASAIRDRWALLVDDGMATGVTMQAAIAALRLHEVAGITVAVPVASRRALALVSDWVDEVECLALPEPFHDIGQS
ncbi:MAG: phosphoribosyltransferase, partial [Pseudomonadales bacterium]|nr:phosphoribosyltransferase [Pseudomonadales bacterium]